MKAIRPAYCGSALKSSILTFLTVFFFSFLSDALQNDQKGRKSGSPLKQGVFRPVNLAKSTLD